MHDVVVIGGGLIGSAVARELALNGLRVLLFERGRPERTASWAAAGMLSPLAESEDAGGFLDFLRASRKLYPSFTRSIEEATGLPTGYRSEGTFLVALNESDEAALRQRFAWQRAADLPVEWLTGDETRQFEPAISGEARAALRFDEDHQVDNRLLLEALRVAAGHAGVDRRIEEVAGIVRQGERVSGVQLRSGERVEAGWVVVAAGVWCSRLEGLPRPLPLRPVHGQLLALHPGRPLIRHVLDSPRIYLVPRADGRVIVGATVEEIGFEQRVTAAGIHTLLGAALELIPELEHARFGESWSGLRPGTPDHLPILGADPDLPNLVYATGHYRNGVLLTPITAEVVADLVMDRPSRLPLAAYAPDRFGPAG
ncbi:MAG TPA: glycine oxidase ThiO [Longimicrobiaceae bacterium]